MKRGWVKASYKYIHVKRDEKNESFWNYVFYNLSSVNSRFTFGNYLHICIFLNFAWMHLRSNTQPGDVKRKGLHWM